jgi:methylase of polypeptide subunit release factors
VISFPIDQSFDIKHWCVKIETATSNYPDLIPYVKNDKLDFGDHKSLEMYNKAVAYTLAGLKIKIPETHLIPAVCLRYAYVRTIFEKFLKTENTMLEIGTGASGIIAMFGAKLYNLKVTATEINGISYHSAESNFQRNTLSNRISLIKSRGGIMSGVIKDGSRFDALFTYPPTYADSSQDSGKLNKGRGFKGIDSEMIGGGIDGFDFTDKLLLEACSDQFDIKIITVMCLFKSHVAPSLAILKEQKRKTQVIELLAGTRKRYIVIGY